MVTKFTGKVYAVWYFGEDTWFIMDYFYNRQQAEKYLKEVKEEHHVDLNETSSPKSSYRPLAEQRRRKK
jgi:hypothetical protein